MAAEVEEEVPIVDVTFVAHGSISDVLRRDEMIWNWYVVVNEVCSVYLKNHIETKKWIEFKQRKTEQFCFGY